jgi:hypothetical protein
MPPRAFSASAESGQASLFLLVSAHGASGLGRDLKMICDVEQDGWKILIIYSVLTV